MKFTVSATAKPDVPCAIEVIAVTFEAPDWHQANVIGLEVLNKLGLSLADCTTSEITYVREISTRPIGRARYLHPVADENIGSTTP